jgi:small GTP-binding protein
VEFWSDRQITAGNKWDEEIKVRLSQTDIALVLVSQWFLDSAYCLNTEVSSFLNGCRERGLVIFPIILSACDWQRHDWLKEHQFLPGGDQTIEEHYCDAGRRKRLYLQIRLDLQKQVDRVRQSRIKSAEATVSPLPAPPATEQRPTNSFSSQIKVCMLGAFAVGKTSLVARFVTSVYSDRYLTTVGVKVDKKTMTFEERKVVLMIWDLAGEDEFQRVQMSYLSGASGYLLVADGTRRATLDLARQIQRRVAHARGPLPFALLVNKADLKDQWEIEDDELKDLMGQGWSVLISSAKTGQSVEEAFLTLTQKILGA